MFCVFFFPSKSICRLFLKKKTYYTRQETEIPRHASLLTTFIVLWMLVQIALPLRHRFIKDNVLWTEEGHRLSWRMMLRTKSGTSTFTVVDKKTGEKTTVHKREYLSAKQSRVISTKPDMMWQFAQRLKKEYAQKGKDIEVYVHAKVSVNRRTYRKFIDHEVDLASVPWNYFKHNDWILPSQLDKK